MPPKKEAVVASVEVKAATISPLIAAAQVQHDKWLARLADTRSRVDQCAEQLRRSKEASGESEHEINTLLQQATDLVNPKEIKDTAALPAIAPTVAAGKGVKGKGKDAPLAQTVAVVGESVTPLPPVFTEAQLKRKAKVQAALLNAYRKKKFVPLADDTDAPIPVSKNGSPSKNSIASKSTVAAAPSAPAAAPADGLELGLGTPRFANDMRPTRPNDPLATDELWDTLMTLRDTRIVPEDKIAVLKVQIDMLQLRMASLLEMEKITQYASAGAEDKLAATVLRVEDMQRLAKEQGKLDLDAKQLAQSTGGPVAAMQLGPIKNAPGAVPSPRQPGKK